MRHGDESMDERLVNDAIAGSKEAFCALYGAYKDKLYRYALYRLGDPSDAEDAVSECVLAAWQSIGSLRSGKAFASWIFRILSNCCASHIRKTINARDRLDRLSKEAPDITGGNVSPSPSLSAELTEALMQLNAEEREIVLLSVIGGLNSSEISSLTGLTSGSVRSKLSRSLAKMRDFLS